MQILQVSVGRVLTELLVDFPTFRHGHFEVHFVQDVHNFLIAVISFALDSKNCVTDVARILLYLLDDFVVILLKTSRLLLVLRLIQLGVNLGRQ